MAYNAGDIESKLDVDRSPFITGLKSALAEAEAWKKKAEKALKPKADIDNKPFTRALTAMQASLTKTFGKTYTAKVRIDDTGQLPKLTELNKRLTALGQRNVKPKVSVQVDDASLKAVSSRITALGRNQAIKVDLNTSDFYVQLKVLETALNLATKDREIFIDINWSRARASLKRLAMELALVTHDRNINIDINVNQNGVGQLRALGGVLGDIDSVADSSSSGGLDRYQKRLLLIGSAVTVGAAPALGVLSTLLATIPFAAGAATASFAVLQMGFDNFATAVSNPVTAAEIKRKEAALANLSPVARQVADVFENELKPAFGNLQSDIQDRIFQGVAGRFREMIVIMPQLRGGLLQLAGSFNFIGNAILDVITKSENLKMIGSMLGTFAGHITNLAPAFANLTQAFLTMANIGNQTFGSLVSVLNTFAADFNNMINIMTQTGVLQGAFQQLAVVTGALLYAFTQLMEAGFKAMVALGPSLNTFIRAFVDLLVAMMPLLTQISATFMDLMVPALDILTIVFNKLGPPIIRILDILGQALVDAINGLMPFIDALATQVGDILMAAVNAIVPILPDLVKAIVDLGMALIPVVNQVGPLFVELIKGMAPLLPPLSSAFLQIVDALIPLIPLMTDMAMTILPPLIGAFVMLAKVVGPVMQIAADIIGGLIRGLVGAITLIYNAISFVVNGMINFFKTLLGISSPSTVFAQFGNWIIQGLINGVTAMIGAVLGVFTALWNGIKAVFDFAWNAIKAGIQVGLALISAIWNTTWTAVSNFFSTIWQGISSFATNVWNAIVAFLQAGLNAFSAFWSGVWNGILNFFTTLWNNLRNTAIALWNALVAFWQAGLNAFNAFWSNIWNTILNFFVTLWNNLKAQAIALWTALVTWYMTALNAWNAFWTNIWNTILNFFINLWNQLYARAQQLWNMLRMYWDMAIMQFKAFWERTWTDIKNRFESIFNGIIDIAKRIWDTVKGVFRDSINAVIRGVNWPVDKINGLFGINIPKLPEIGGLKAGGHVDWSHNVPSAPIGPVRGPGGPRDDKVLTRLSNKEHVWSAAEVKAAGGHEAVAMMRKNVLAGAGANGTSTNPFQLSGMGNSRMSGQERLNLMKRPNMDDVGNVKLAFGGVKPHVAEAGFAVERALGKMPGGIGGVGQRANASDHPGGYALDFMTMSNMALGDRVAAFLTQGWGPMSVKYLIWKQRIAERPNAWAGMENRGSATANHMDHVHASFLGGHDGGGGLFAIDYGAIFDSTAGFLKPLGEGVVRGAIPNPPLPNWIEDMGVSLYNKGWDGLRKKAIELMESVMGWLGGGGGTGNVEQWRPAVLASLARVGQPAGHADITLRRMNQESGGNPRAINNWDSNARKGTPSKGLMQVIDPTFQAHRDRGLPNDIWDPVANIVASMRYALSRYGSLPAAYNRAGGYDSGGMLQPGWTHAFNGTGSPEVVLTSAQWESLYETARDARQLVQNQTTNNNGVSAADLERIIRKVMEARPLIGSVNQQLPQGTSSKDLVDELTFELRHYTKGMYE